MADAITVGISGSGFIARGFLLAAQRTPPVPGSVVRRVLTRRDLGTLIDFPAPDLLTNSLDQLIDECAVVVECSGDVLHATRVIDAALRAGRIVVTMNAEFHVTTGSYFVGRGTFTEAHGDQPGALAELAEQARAMGFLPLVYGNRKGYYHPDPPRDQMEYWARKQGISLDQVIAATDGTKIHIEQALVANGLGATIAQGGMLGPTVDTLTEGAAVLAECARRLGQPLADYVIAPTAPAGVFLIGEHDPRQQASLSYLKLGEGPFYTLVQPHHLCHLEIGRTIRRVVDGGPPLLDNSRHPRIGVAAVAKRPLEPGHLIRRGIGSFELRGEAVQIARHPRLLPIGLVTDAVVRRSVAVGQQLEMDDVEIPDSLAFTAWRHIAETRSLVDAP